MPVEEAVDQSSGSGGVSLAGRYNILPDKPLSDLDSLSAKAYLVEDEKSDDSFFALISDKLLPPRQDILLHMRTLEDPGIMKPIHWGGVFWPALQRRVFAAVFPLPAGGSLTPSLSVRMQPMREEVIIDQFVSPLVTIIKEFHLKNLAHRSIRPDNIYFGDAERHEVMLGECFIAPPGSENPVAFETIANSQSHPLGRSVGGYAEDLYALGVTLLFLLLGRLPGQNIEENDLIHMKIEQGSYNALAGKERVPRVIKELLRGILTDNEDERWPIEDIELWIDGKRGSPQQPNLPKRGRRPISIGENSYFTCRSLAHGLYIHRSEALAVIRDAEIENWIQRTVGDEEMAKSFVGALSNIRFADSDPNASDLTVSLISSSLDPEGPIRYKEFRAMPEGLGSYLAYLYSQPSGAQLFADTIFADITILVIESQFGAGGPSLGMTKEIEHIRSTLKQTGFGGGIERCLYDMNPAMPCLSPLLKDYFVMDDEDILPAMEQVAAKSPDTLPMDRHISAFISARFKKDTNNLMKGLSNRDLPALVVLSLLRIYSIMQWRMGPKKLPSLCGWIGKLLGPVIDSYHSIPLRKKLHSQLQGAVVKGSLIEVLNLVDDPNHRREDETDFRNDLIEYASMNAEIAELSLTSDGQSRESKKTANRISAGVSLFIAILIITMMIIVA